MAGGKEAGGRMAGMGGDVEGRAGGGRVTAAVAREVRQAVKHPPLLQRLRRRRPYVPTTCSC